MVDKQVRALFCRAAGKLMLLLVQSTGRAKASQASLQRALLRIIAAQVRQSTSRDTLRLHKVLNMSMQPLHARLRTQLIKVENTKASTSSASTMSTAMNPALQTRLCTVSSTTRMISILVSQWSGSSSCGEFDKMMKELSADGYDSVHKAV